MVRHIVEIYCSRISIHKVNAFYPDLREFILLLRERSDAELVLDRFGRAFRCVLSDAVDTVALVRFVDLCRYYLVKIEWLSFDGMDHLLKLLDLVLHLQANWIEHWLIEQYFLISW